MNPALEVEGRLALQRGRLRIAIEGRGGRVEVRLGLRPSLPFLLWRHRASRSGLRDLRRSLAARGLYLHLRAGPIPLDFAIR